MKNSLLLLALSILLGSMSILGTPKMLTHTEDESRTLNTVNVSLPTVEVSPGQTVSVPITVSSLTGLDVVSFDLVFDFNPSVLSVTSVSNSGTLSSGFTITPNLATPGRVTISGFGTEGLSGSGILIYVNFTAVGEGGSTSNLTWQSALLNEGSPATNRSNGSISVLLPCSYGIGTTSEAFVASGGTGSISVTTSRTGCQWSATPNNSWIQITSGGTGSTSGTVAYTVASNDGPARTGTITAAGQTFTINQASGCSYTIGSSSANILAAGTSGTIAVSSSNSGCAWTATSAFSWVTITSGSTGSGNGTVGYTVASNNGPARTGTITAAGRTFTINQASGCTYSLSTVGIIIPNAQSVGALNVESNFGCPWTASSNASWLSVDSGSSGVGTGQVIYKAEVNSGDTRTGTILVAGHLFTVTQSDSRAFFPDGKVQEIALSANDGRASDRFGESVAVSGDFAVIGAPGDDVGSNFDQGSVYLFTRVEGIWSQVAKLVSPDGQTGDQFGKSVALSNDDAWGTTIIIGAPSDAINANPRQGSAYVFVSDEGRWTMQQKLIAQDGDSEDNFGMSVGSSEGSALVGAPGREGGKGAAYVFLRSNSTSTWSLQQKLVAPDGMPLDAFGTSVAIGGADVIVGAKGADIDGRADQGAAYSFKRLGSNWVNEQKLLALEGASGDEFGSSIGLSNDPTSGLLQKLAVIGSPGSKSRGAFNQGAAFVFSSTGSAWNLEAKLVASDGLPNDRFGENVSIWRGTVVIGAPEKVIGSQVAQGALYLFDRSVSGWVQRDILTDSDGAAGDRLGSGNAIFGDTIISGIPLADSEVGSDQGVTKIFQTLIDLNAVSQSSGVGFDLAVSGDIAVSGSANGGIARVYHRELNRWVFKQQLEVTEPLQGEKFGWSVAVSGNTIAVGSVVLDSSSGATSAGSVYVFVRNGTSWTLQAKLVPPDGQPGDGFGHSVGLSGETLLVGSRFDKINLNRLQGSAYVFSRVGETWVFVQKLTASDGAVDNQFGYSVSIMEDVAVVGAYYGPGRAYIFEHLSGTWVERKKLSPTDSNSCEFGSEVAVFNYTVAVGANCRGSVTLFTRSGETWVQEQVLLASDGKAESGLLGESFGRSISLNAETLAIGSFGKDLGSRIDQGAVYLFSRSGNNWTERRKLFLGQGASEDRFGTSVSLTDGGLLVGSGWGDASRNKLTSFYWGPGAGCSFELSSPSISIPSLGGAGTFGVVSGNDCPWFVTSNSSWVTVTSGSTGSGNGTVGFTVASNDGPARTGTITAGGQTFTINQASGCSYTLGSSSADILATGSSGTIAVSSSNGGCAWTATTDSSWVTVTSGSTGSGNGTVGFTVASNNGPTRTGTITAAGRTFTINQASGCTQTLSPSSGNFDASGGNGSIGVTSSNGGCAWTATSNSPWVTLTSGASGSGAGSVVFGVTANTGPARAASIAVGDKVFSLSQSSGCSLEISSSSSTVTNESGSGSFDVLVGEGCVWTAQSGSPWLQITSGSNGVGNGRVDFGFTANTGSTRTASIAVGEKVFDLTQGAAASCISVSIGNYEVVTQSILTLPIAVTEVTGRGIESFDLELNYDGNILAPIASPLDLVGTLAADWTVTVNSPSPGRLLVSAFGTTPLVGSGSLIKLSFDVVGARGTSTNVRFGSFGFNDDDPCSGLVSGRVTVSEIGDVAGAVRYFTNSSGQTPKAVPGVTITAAGTPEVSVDTNESGAYLLDGFGPGAYTVTPSKPGSATGISSLDASRIAQWLVGLTTLSEDQLVVADVTGNGQVNSFDASRISQWLVSIPPSSGQNLTGTWKFSPSSRIYESVRDSLTGQDFKAFLLGDVTGNWAPPASLADDRLDSGAVGQEIGSQLSVVGSRKSVTGGRSDVAKAIGFGIYSDIARTRGVRNTFSGAFGDKASMNRTASPRSVGEVIEIPISVADAMGILAYDAVITYDSDVIEPVIDRPIDSNGTLSTNFNVVVNRSERGKIRLGAYGVVPATGDGDLIVLRFRVKRPFARLADAKLAFESLVINEESVVGRQ